jgi:hypothetical protein
VTALSGWTGSATRAFLSYRCGVLDDREELGVGKLRLSTKGELAIGGGR